MSESGSVPPLRIAVLGDFEGIHTRRWLEVFVQRGHDVHAISYYRPGIELPGVSVHVLSGSEAPSGGGAQNAEGMGVTLRGAARRLMPPDLQRLLQARRYDRAGLRRVLAEIEPDVFHAHYAVEHGFYGSLAGFHPYVVSAWGSDLLVESRKPLGRLIARRALRSADLVTANDTSLAQRARELGVPPERIAIVHLGIDRMFLEAGERSVNLNETNSGPPTIISTRALEPLYNVDVVIRAFAMLRERVPEARLIVAHDGGERERLEALAKEAAPSASITFTGRLQANALAELLAKAHVYVSVPSSDSLALSTVEAMAAGSFPVVADLPSNEGWIRPGTNALTVPRGNIEGLAKAMQRALTDVELRREAAVSNRARATAEGLRERNMLLMERHYYRLAGHPVAGEGEAI